MPNYACAVVATMPSRVLQRIGRRLREAQDLGSYQLVELLGRGGMGEVWRARHRLLARGAAIKLIRPELLGASSPAESDTACCAGSSARRRPPRRSARRTRSAIFDFGVTDDRTFYYVMELLDGRDLESLVREFGPVPADRVVFLLRQVCHSLAEAHARGLVHRDVTPANIYVCRMGLDYDFVKVLDFGLVKFNGQAIVDGDSTVDRRRTPRPGRPRSWRRRSCSKRRSGRARRRLRARLRRVLPADGSAGVRGDDADARCSSSTCRRRRFRRRSGPSCPFRPSWTPWSWRASKRTRRSRPQDAAEVLRRAPALPVG